MLISNAPIYVYIHIQTPPAKPTAVNEWRRAFPRLFMRYLRHPIKGAFHKAARMKRDVICWIDTRQIIITLRVIPEIRPTRI